MFPLSRPASHAESWYTANGTRLGQQLQGWLDQVPAVEFKRPARAIIAPHAGYSYSGPTAAHAYGHIDADACERVFILGPSHHYYLSGCALTRCAKYDTPLGQLTIDRVVTQQLMDTGQFEWMSQDVDEAEHSIEMHLPFVYHIMRTRTKPFTVVPILIGGLSKQAEIDNGDLLSPYLADPANLFIVSSDFCHWGRRFSYAHYDKSCGAIHQSIEVLDREGMQLIEKLDADGFHSYLKDKRNTICGRHPIAVLLRAVLQWRLTSDSKPVIKFTHYAQSSKVIELHDSSVSYASAILFDGD